jgi:autotransporter-associated beta strand protein
MADATWLANPGSNDFDTAANWDTGTVPTGTAFFDTSGVTALLSRSFDTTLGGWTFNAGASDYAFIMAGSFAFNGAGVVINGGSASIANDFQFVFYNASTAGGASITNYGQMYFYNASTAGGANITNNANLQFYATSSAGSASITNTGTLQFNDSSTAGNAAITNTAFGATDFSQSTGPNGDRKLSAGSINGDGAFFLGQNELTVGGNNLSTNVTGVIYDGGPGVVGVGKLVKTGTGTMTLSAADIYGANTYSGGTTFAGGAISVSSDADLGDAAGGLTFNGGALQVTGTTFNATARTITWGAGGGGFDIADAANNFTVSQNLTGGALTKSGVGTLTLTGADTFAGGTTISAGTLQIGDGGTTGSLSGDIVNNAALVFNRSDAITFGDVISGTGTLEKLGTGTLTLFGINIYTGAITVTGGTLEISGSIASTTVTNNSFLAYTGSGTAGSATITNTDSLSFYNSSGWQRQHHHQQ